MMMVMGTIWIMVHKAPVEGEWTYPTYAQGGR